MKITTSQLTAKILFVLLFPLLTACTDEVTTAESTTYLSICATKGQFTDSGGASTRLSTGTDYISTFTDGDQIGVTMIKNGAVIYKNDNICYTYEAATGKWVTTGKNPPVYYDADATYIAYYPYDASMNGKLTTDAIIQDFAPSTDQSTPEGYNRSDLMVAQGVIVQAAQTLTFSFTRHEMVLCEFHLAGESYQTSNGYVYSRPVEDGQGQVSANVDGTEIKCYQAFSNRARLLIKPTASAVSLNITIVSNGKTYNIANQALEKLPTVKGTYKQYNIRCDVTGNRNFSQGDRFHSDGCILPYYADAYRVNPTGNPCIGVMLQVGAGWGESVATYGGKLTNSYINGYVIALESSSRTYSSNYSGDGSSGYTNTTIMHNRTVNEGAIKNPVAEYPYEYEKTTPAPKESSGWYSPANSQMSTIRDRRNNALFRKSNGNYIIPGGYMGSSTGDGSRWRVAGDWDGFFSTYHGNGATIHPLFTF